MSRVTQGNVGRKLGVIGPSGIPMPNTNLPGWSLIFNDDFTQVVNTWGACTTFGTGDPPDRECPQLPEPYRTKWWAYMTDYMDTREKLDGTGGFYHPANQMMYEHVLQLKLERIAGTSRSCAPIANIGTDNGPGLVHDQTYGRYSVCFYAQSSPHFKIAWLLFRDVDTWGEIDFPEANLDGTISAFNHHDGGGQTEFPTATNCAGQWHVCTIEWKPNNVEFFLNGTSIGSESGIGIVPDDLMTWVLQSETRLGGSPPPADVLPVYIWIDWVAVWSYAP